MQVTQNDMRYLRTSTFKILISSFCILLFVVGLSAEFDECTSHNILDDPYRNKDYRLKSQHRTNSRICDSALERGWYVFKLSEKFAEIPTECVDVHSCGTMGPMWLNTNGQVLPLPGENRTFHICTTEKPRNFHPKLGGQNCCGFTMPITVRNCGEFFVYLLSPAPTCSLAYCAQEAKVRCKPWEYSSDGFAPCKEKYPTIKNKPILSVAIRNDGAYLSSSYESSSESTDNVSFQVTWYKTENEIHKELLTLETNKTISVLPLKDHIEMGDEVFCKVLAFFENTRNFRSPSVESTLFKAEIRISSKHLEVKENGENHKVTFETTVPVVCDQNEKQCSIKIPLAVDKDENNLHTDIAISECFVEIKPRKCSKRNCGKGVIYIKAVTDFVRDGTRISNIRTGAIASENKMWNGYTIDDLTVAVEDVPGAQCYSFTDPHFITFDRLKYDFYKTGTYILHKSLNRDFEVNSRIWNCGGATDEISCNCGFVARENNDVISVDMCNGVLLETKPEVKIKSPLPLGDGVKIKESKSGKKITISFSSGSFVRADISGWGLSISVQIPSSDFNHTSGLCGIFDGDPSNDYHHSERNKMDLEMKFGQANEFVEMWRLRDGGLFNHLPEYKQYSKRKRFCNCEKPRGSPITVERKCTRYDDVIRTDLIKSKDMTTKYKAKSSGARPKRDIQKDNELALGEYIDSDVTNDGYYFYPDDHDSDLRPVTPKWPTPTGITELQAIEMCEKKLSNSSLASLCSKALGSNMYIEDAVAMCVADLQLTDDFRWHSYAYTLIENECEKAIVENQMMWNDQNVEDDLDNLQESLNCPYNCSGNGKCTLQGCKCDDGFSSVDCSVRQGTPTITRIGENGLCDKTTQICDEIKVNVNNVKKSYFIRCHLTLLNTNEEVREFYTRGAFRNKQTLHCSLPQNTIKSGQEPIKWAVQVSFNSGPLSNAVIVTVFDSSCFYCDWQGICNIRVDSCFIEQTCRSIGETSHDNDCLTCIPNQNIYEWSIKEDNMDPVFTLPPPLFVFVGNTLEYQLEAFDLDGDVVVYDLIWKEDGVSLSESGKLLWTPLEPKQILIPVMATDKCGAVVTATVEVTVIDCPCQNGGKCSDDQSYQKKDVVCDCSTNFIGLHCEDFVRPYDLVSNICQPNPCQHGSCSLSSDGLLVCQCDAGYTGVLCEQSMNLCDPNPCFLGVECIAVSPESIECGDCPPGHIGDGITCREASFCSIACPKNMRCTVDDRCVCEKGWTGYGCRIALCRPDCQNGKCVSPGVCKCYAGYSGKFCDKAICAPGCENGGVCYARNVCACPSGYVGARCQTMTCRVNCQNGGYCSDPDTCVCPKGYTGPTCSQAICQPGCMNGGLCVKPSQCLCLRGYHGQYCQTGVCQEACMNGGRCVRKNTCSCLPGFVGKRCEKPVCEPRCLNHGRCVAPNTCSCSSGWRGRHCQKAICNNGCRSGGVCIKPDVCACQQGFRGASCQTPICRRPCMYGGRCVEPDKCSCRHGYTGTYCENRVSGNRFHRPRRHYL